MVQVVSTEIESIHGAGPPQQLVFYRCLDSDGHWHTYGPIVVNEPGFDIEAHKPLVAAKINEMISEVS
jgi:hypothetical protein